MFLVHLLSLSCSSNRKLLDGTKFWKHFPSNTHLMNQWSLIITFLFTLLVSLSMSGCYLIFGLKSVHPFVPILRIQVRLENEVMLLSKCYTLIYEVKGLSAAAALTFLIIRNLLFFISVVQSAPVIFVETVTMV